MKLLFLCFFALLLPLRAAEFERTVRIDAPKAGTRASLADRPFFFAETLLKYGMGQNYIDRFIDRPLFVDRKAREGGWKCNYITPLSLKTDAVQLAAYGMDGFAIFGNPVEKLNLIRRSDELWAACAPPGLKQLLLYYCGEANVHGRGTLGNSNELAELLRLAYGSEHFFRLDGKLLIAEYNARFFSPAQYAEKRRELELAGGRKDFLLPGELPADFSRAVEQEYRHRGMLSPETVARLKEQIAAVLRCSDGIQIKPFFYDRTKNRDYTSVYNTGLFRKFLAPALLEVLGREENRGKILGVHVERGYLNHFSGNCHGDYGTESFRDNMNAVLPLKPDYILFFEWNEVCENTCFAPTVSNSFALQRLIRYYAAVARGEAPVPNPGDDPAVPNLVLSCRNVLKMGERILIEVLNIPDGGRGRVVFQLRLKDASGNVVRRFPEETINAGELAAVTYALPSEDFPAGTVLTPVLTAAGREFDGFSNLRIDPTMCWNYKMNHHPLRDTLIPEEVRFTAEKTGDNRYRVRGAVKAARNLKSLELLDGETILRAADPADEFRIGRGNRLFRVAFSMERGKRRFASGELRVKNVSDFVLKPHGDTTTDSIAPRKDKNGIGIRVFLWEQLSNYYLSLPAAEAAGAVVVLELPESGEHYEIPLAGAERTGIWSQQLNTTENFRVDVIRLDRLPDLPYNLKAREAEIDASLDGVRPNPAFSLRAITEDGKIYRSAALTPDRLSGATVPLDFISDTTGEHCRREVSRELVPDLDYRFRPDSGAAVTAAGADPFFAAFLGGGFHYMEAFSHPLTKIPAGGRMPEWKEENGRFLLSLNGICQYINLTKEVFPTGAFTLEMEVRPEAQPGVTPVLFRHFNQFVGSLSLFLKEGELVAAYTDRELKTKFVETGLPVPAGEWSRIRVAYDFRTLSFGVNGRTHSIPFSGRPYSFKSAIIGGHSKPEFAPGGKPAFFKGAIRALRIRHWAEKE